jgi:hypothetical protein
VTARVPEARGARGDVPITVGEIAVPRVTRIERSECQAVLIDSRIRIGILESRG